LEEAEVAEPLATQLELLPAAAAAMVRVALAAEEVARPRMAQTAAQEERVATV
jgi:hypothetical protein